MYQPGVKAQAFPGLSRPSKETVVRATPSPPESGVAILVGTLVAIYSVSQFLRNSIAVIANDLARELHLSATEVGLLSSAFFLAFAAAQIPVGIAIDRYGPKRTMLGSAVICVLGTALFAFAGSAAVLIGARALMGLGCSTFFMAPLAIYARRFAPERFAFLTSLQLGIGSAGTLLATAPLANATATIGWRPAFAAVAAATAAIALIVAIVIPRDEAHGRSETWGETFAGVAAALRVPSFWPVFLAHVTSYASFATVIGLWAGPWLSDVHGADLETRGRILLVGAIAQILGVFVWGYADRYVRSYRRSVLLAASLAVVLLLVASAVSLTSTGAAVWLALFGFAVAYGPIVTAHGKSLFPTELTGRGITLMNMGTMSGVFLLQTATGILVDLIGRNPQGGYSAEAYRAVFLVLALALAASLIPYARAIDPHPSKGHGSYAGK
jgi:predicted MFS family arabinose efflux permease